MASGAIAPYLPFAIPVEIGSGGWKAAIQTLRQPFRKGMVTVLADLARFEPS